MSMSDPLIFESFTLENEGGGNAETFELMDSDNIDIGNEAEKLTVENAQEIIAGLTSSMKVPCFDLDVVNDVHVTEDSNPAVKSRITLDGAEGSSSVQIDGVYVTAVLKFDRPAPYYEVSVQIKAAEPQVKIV